MSRTPPVKTRVVVGLLISIAVHAGALALVTIEIPEPGQATISLVRLPVTDLTDPAPEPVITVVEIRPPGMRVPSGGGGAADRVPTVAKPTDQTSGAVSVAAPAPRRTASRGVSTVSLAPRSPIAQTLDIVLAAAPAEEPDDAEATSTTRKPARGVVLRGTGETSPTGSTGAGTPGRGIGIGTGGLTIIGPGGDCITPGLAVPSRKVPDERPQLGAGARTTGRIGSRFRPR